MWIEIFKTGTHTDSSGKTRGWAEADLDEIISKYDPSQHEAPVVIGHPSDSAPAYGWVDKLKREGEILYAKFKDLVPEFVDMVKQGLFKKRSISLYPNLGLQHVGFLGATPPAIKGLNNINFKEGDSAMNYEFTADADPGEQLHRKTLEIMKNPPKFDAYGREHRGYSYSEALSIAQRENPELTEKYCEILFQG